MLIRFTALPTEEVRALQRGGKDAYGLMPERKFQMATAFHAATACEPSRPESRTSCLPIGLPGVAGLCRDRPDFLCAEECERAAESDVIPEMFKPTPDYIVRGYDQETGSSTAPVRWCRRARFAGAR